VIRRIVACLVAGLSLDSVAHDQISADSVQAYLSRVGELRKSLTPGNASQLRAQASLQLGRTLDEIGDLFNEDIAAHGQVQGLASGVLMSELTAGGTPPAYSKRANRFTTNLAYYRDALRWEPSGPVAAEASFSLLKGYFYESLAGDPLRPVAQSQTQLAEQIRLGEMLRTDFPRHAQREEISFILAIHYMQAARAADQVQTRHRFLADADELVREYVKAYPDSIRTPALKAMLESASRPK